MGTRVGQHRLVFRGEVEYIKQQHKNEQANQKRTRDDLSVEAAGALRNANGFLLAFAVGLEEVSNFLQDLQRLSVGIQLDD